MKNSANDFWIGVRPILEETMGVKILPLEQLQETTVTKAFDHAGIDAFYLKDKNLKGLASRVNYHRFVENTPAFSLRYALWSKRYDDWDLNREYKRKLEAARNPGEFIFFPDYHVESFNHAKGKGKIGWSYLAKTADIVEYISAYDGKDTEKVRVFQPKSGERRKVVSVPIHKFAQECDVIKIKSTDS